jgi:hypothetical protein
MRDAVGGGSIGTQLVDCPIAQQLRLPFRPRVQREPVVLHLRFLEDLAYLQSLASASVTIPSRARSRNACLSRFIEI